MNRVVVDEARDAMFTASASGTVKMWSLSNLRQMETFEGLHARSTFSESGVCLHLVDLFVRCFFCLFVLLLSLLRLCVLVFDCLLFLFCLFPYLLLLVYCCFLAGFLASFSFFVRQCLLPARNITWVFLHGRWWTWYWRGTVSTRADQTAWSSSPSHGADVSPSTT